MLGWKSNSGLLIYLYSALSTLLLAVSIAATHHIIPSSPPGLQWPCGRVSNNSTLLLNELYYRDYQIHITYRSCHGMSTKPHESTHAPQGLHTLKAYSVNLKILVSTTKQDIYHQKCLVIYHMPSG
jgi:hypothetical protein